jgi:membrane fusion protein (multidrug efflux system)
MEGEAKPQTEQKPAAPTGPPLYKRPLFWIMVGAILLIAAVAGVWSFYERRHFVATDDAYIEVKKVSISPDIPGRILKLYVDEGSKVCCGDLIAELDPSIELAKKEKALRQELKMQKVLMQAEQKKLKIEEDYGRIAKAYDVGIATRQERDDLMRDFKMADIGTRIARIDVEIARAQIEWINENLRHLKIYAPTNGVIAKRWL